MRARVGDAFVCALAEWAGGEPWTTRPLPADRPGLVLADGALQLRLPGLPDQAWHPGLVTHRLGVGPRDPLVRALGASPGERVLDGTLGFGHDALVLAKNGVLVHALESRPEVACFTLWGLGRYAPRLARSIHVTRADHAALLPTLGEGAYDHVYLDPMYPPGELGPNGTWEPLRRVGQPGGIAGETLRAARRVARTRVVLKLAPGALPPEVEGLEPGRLLGSRRLRFAIWGPPALDP